MLQEFVHEGDAMLLTSPQASRTSIYGATGGPGHVQSSVAGGDGRVVGNGDTLRQRQGSKESTPSTRLLNP